MTNPFTSRITNTSPVPAISLMCLLLGVMISFAVTSNSRRESGLVASDPEQQQRLMLMSQGSEKLKEEVSKLQKENQQLQSAVSDRAGRATLISKSLQDIKQFAGLTEVVGPGVSVTLKDVEESAGRIDQPLDQMVIHDIDVLKMVNELWNAGAEAIAVNGNRVAVGSNYRCVGTTILVDGVKVASPIIIQAIGDRKTLSGALRMAGGLYYELRQTSPQMIDIVEVDSMKLPAFSGSTTHKFAKAVKEEKQK
jgi:uncharacterized protein YlxW (UPF0749 family)